MTREEALKIAEVAKTADGGCSKCVSDMCEELTDAKLGWEFTHAMDEETLDHVITVKEAP